LNTLRINDQSFLPFFTSEKSTKTKTSSFASHLKMNSPFAIKPCETVPGAFCIEDPSSPSLPEILVTKQVLSLLTSHLKKWEETQHQIAHILLVRRLICYTFTHPPLTILFLSLVALELHFGFMQRVFSFRILRVRVRPSGGGRFVLLWLVCFFGLGILGIWWVWLLGDIYIWRVGIIGSRYLWTASPKYYLGGVELGADGVPRSPY